jgi:hypothetical protein
MKWAVLRGIITISPRPIENLRDAVTPEPRISPGESSWAVLGTHCGATSYEITVTFKAARPAMATKGNAIKALGKP